MLNTWKPVLVVDDNRTMGQIVKRLLRRVGFRDVAVRTTALDGMHELKRRSYALVISDLEMQPISGLNFVRMIRSHSITWQLPILLMTANKALAFEAFNSPAPVEANAFIFKPFTAIELKSKISEVLEARFTDKSLMPSQLAKLNGDWAPSHKREMIEETLMMRIRNVGLCTGE